VADFYEYDEKGRVIWQHKYLGAMERSKRYQTSGYQYDETDRLVFREAFEGGNPYVLLAAQGYNYDAAGRATSITGAYGDTLTWYAYAAHGPLGTVDLGHGTPGTTVAYGYHIRGWTKDVSVRRYSNDYETYRQALGYESKAITQASVPDLTRARYTGQITQQLYKFTSDVSNPVRTVNYSYDMLGRMTTADYRHGTGLDGEQYLQFPLSLSDAVDLDTRVAYDLNGRILGKRSGGVSSGDSAVYQYAGDSYRLESVDGKLSSGPRDASRFQNFQYDIAGRMTQDLSKGLEVAYAPDGMPVEMAVRQGFQETAVHQFYDASGYRVSQVVVPRLAHGFPVYWVGTAQGTEDPGLYTATTIDNALADANYLLNFQNYPAPDSLVLYVVPDAGEAVVEPEFGELEHLMKGDTVIPVVIHGALKYSAKYDSLMAKRAGKTMMARHEVRHGGWSAGEIREGYDAGGVVTVSARVGNVHGRGSTIGRVVHTDTGMVYQYFIKNHLGSTVRVVNADGSYATTPVFDYQAYGELQSIREDSLNPVSQKYTGKELDSEVNLYYFGARWYDQELGMWISPDPANDGFNPYGYVGGSPIMFIDPYGLWKMGVGVVVGWNRRDGWSIGVGFANDDVDFSHSWNQNGSQTSTIQVSVGGGCIGICLGATAGGSYNTETGYSANAGATAGVGFTEHAQVGVETGTNHYWTTDGKWIGGDVYGGAYAQLGARASAGYSQGFGAIESGFYARASFMGTSAGYHSAQGWNTGFAHRVGVANYDSKGGWSVDNDAKILGGMFAVNTEAGVLAGAGQLASRFTWELPQTVLGVGANYLLNEMGLVSDVSYRKGRVYAEGGRLPGAFTLGNFVGGAFAGHEAHEFGHTIQSQVYGPGYLGIMIASPISAATSSYAAHMGRWYETQATTWGNKAY
jgi:RHS repeat-associated protein